MQKSLLITKILAITGTVFIWIPILLPIVFAVTRLISGRRVVFDFLMPAELFPAILIGAGLLVWAAIRAQSHRKLVFWSLGVAVVSLITGQLLAVVTGLASGEREATGIWWFLVIATIAIYNLSVISLGIAGIALFLKQFFPEKST